MTRREALGMVAAIGLLAVLVVALAFILRTAAEMETAEREARTLAAHEERVRLALWRLDSKLSGFLAYENVRPPGAAPEGAEEGDEDVAAEVGTDEALVARRFEVDADQEAESSTPSYDDLQSKLAQADEELPDFGLTRLPAAPLPTAPAPTAVPVGDPLADPVAAEVESQMFANTAEFSQRQSFAGQQSQFVLPPIRETAKPRVETRAGLLRPLWHDVSGATTLLLVRRLNRGGVESVQGLELDLGALREDLKREIRDLLPGATLEPILDPSAADPARRLALLPLRLDPGPPQPLPSPAGWSAGRLGLTAAVVAVALATLAGGLLLVASFRLARRRSDFASAVIHELRTPLTTFRFYTDMLAEGMVAEEDRQNYAETLRREADRLGHLVENVLAYARLERQGRSGRRAASVERVDFGAWARETFGRLRELAESEGVAWSRNGTVPDGLLLSADPLAVERILFNLCDNSCKYGRGDEAHIEVSLRAESDRATIRWRDHGPGLDASARRGLFQTFRRGAVEGTAGIGLGLALSRRLARGFGGELRTLDLEGPGTLFELTLPVIAAPAEAS